jgi:hypothetical protein
MTIALLTGVFIWANLLTEVFRTLLNILVVPLDILVMALVSPGDDVELDNKAKIYRVHFKDGTSKLVAAKSGQELTGLYAQRVSPKR